MMVQMDVDSTMIHNASIGGQQRRSQGRMIFISAAVIVVIFFVATATLEGERTWAIMQGRLQGLQVDRRMVDANLTLIEALMGHVDSREDSRNLGKNVIDQFKDLENGLASSKRNANDGEGDSSNEFRVQRIDKVTALQRELDDMQKKERLSQIEAEDEERRRLEEKKREVEVLREKIRDLQAEHKRLIDKMKEQTEREDDKSMSESNQIGGEDEGDLHEIQEKTSDIDYKIGSFQSLGNLEVFPGGDMESQEILKDVVKFRSFKNEIIILMVNEGGEKSAINSILNLRRVGIDHYILLVQTENHCRKLREGPFKISCGWTSLLSNEERLSKWKIKKEHCSHCAVPINLWWGRLKYMGELIELGLNVLYMDTDVYVISDPYKYLHGSNLTNHNIVIQRETPATYGLNIGFIYANKCAKDGPCRWIFREALQRLYDLLDVEEPFSLWQDTDMKNITSGKHNRAFGPKAVAWDQNIMNDVIETAVVNKVSHRRSYERGVDDSDRTAWLKYQNYTETRWLYNEATDVYYHRLYSNVSDSLVGTLSDETIAGAPAYLLGGWDGIYGPPEVRGVNGWWFSKPPSVIHFVGSSNDKLPPTALHHLWRVGSECDESSIIKDQCEYLKKKFIGFDGKLFLLDISDVVKSKSTLSREYNRALDRLLHVASVSGRTPILPLLNCSVAQDVAPLHIKYQSWHGIYQQQVLAWPCDSSSYSRYNRKTLNDLNFTLDEEQIGEQNLLTGTVESKKASLCCTPWVSRSVRQFKNGNSVGNCEGKFVYDFELDIIQEGIDIYNSKNDNVKMISIDHVTLKREDFEHRQNLLQKIGVNAEAQIIMIDNMESLYWNEFEDLSDPKEVESMRGNCRVGESF